MTHRAHCLQNWCISPGSPWLIIKTLSFNMILFKQMKLSHTKNKSIFLCILINEYNTLLSTHRWFWGFISFKSKIWDASQSLIVICHPVYFVCSLLGFTLIVHRYRNVSKRIINMPNEGGKCLVWQGPGPHVERLQEYWLESGKFHRLHFCYKYLCVYEHKKHLHLMLMVIIRPGQVFFDLHFIKVYLQVLSY